TVIPGMAAERVRLVDPAAHLADAVVAASNSDKAGTQTKVHSYGDRAQYSSKEQSANRTRAPETKGFRRKRRRAGPMAAGAVDQCDAARSGPAAVPARGIWKRSGGSFGRTHPSGQ